LAVPLSKTKQIPKYDFSLALEILFLMSSLKQTVSAILIPYLSFSLLSKEEAFARI
jgi:hypothetical protein